MTVPLDLTQQRLEEPCLSRASARVEGLNPTAPETLNLLGPLVKAAKVQLEMFLRLAF